MSARLVGTGGFECDERGLAPGGPRSSHSRPGTSATRVVTAASNRRGACSIHGLWPSTVDPSRLLLTETESDGTLSARPPTARSAPAAAASRLSLSEIAIAQQTPQRDASTPSAARPAPSAQSRSQRVRPPPSPRRRSGSGRLRGTRSSARPRSSRRYRHDGRLRGRCGLTLATHRQPPFVNSPVSVIVIKASPRRARRRGGVRMVQVLHP